MKHERNYGVDALRLILMFMICILHVLGHGGILYSDAINSLEYKVYWFLEILAFSAVDSFAIISGYMSNNKDIKYEKIVNMWFWVFFYSYILTIILNFFGFGNLTKLDLIKCFLPVINGQFWYFTAFFILYLSMPILNKFLFEIDKDSAKKYFIMLIILFSGLSIIKDSFIINGGYSCLWLIILYCIGVLARRIDLFKNRNNLTLVGLWLLSVLITWLSFIITGSNRLINYVSPTILGSGLIMVILFSRFNFKGNVICKLSPLAFGIYLFQLNPIIWNYFIKDRFLFILDNNIVIGIISVLGSAYLIFIIGLVIEFIRSKLFNYFEVSKLSEKIVYLLDKLLNKLSIFIK